MTAARSACIRRRRSHDLPFLAVDRRDVADALAEQRHRHGRDMAERCRSPRRPRPRRRSSRTCACRPPPSIVTVMPKRTTSASGLRHRQFGRFAPRVPVAQVARERGDPLPVGGRFGLREFLAQLRPTMASIAARPLRGDQVAVLADRALADVGDGAFAAILAGECSAHRLTLGPCRQPLLNPCRSSTRDSCQSRSRPAANAVSQLRDKFRQRRNAGSASRRSRQCRGRSEPADLLALAARHGGLA